MNSKITSDTGEFNLQLWRQLLADAAKGIDTDNTNIEVINPFGFEVTGDRKFLQRNLRRFYCYFGSANKFEKPPTELAIKLFDNFYKLLLQTDPDFASKIALLIVESDSNFKKLLKDNNYQPSNTDKIFVIEHRIFEEDLLTDYANYLISTLWGFHNKTLPELARFSESQSVRYRIFQLHLILENIFGSTIEALNTNEKILLDKIYNMKGVDISYYFKGKETQLPTNEDTILLDLVSYRTEKMILKIFERNCQEGEIVTIKSKCYNSNHFLTFSMNESAYHSAARKIKSHYNSFNQIQKT